VIFQPFAGIPHWGNRFEFWHVVAYLWHNHPCQIWHHITVMCLIPAAWQRLKSHSWTLCLGLILKVLACLVSWALTLESRQMYQSQKMSRLPTRTTGPPNGPVLFCSLASVVVCNTAGERGAGRPTLHGGPVVLRPVMATPCIFKNVNDEVSLWIHAAAATNHLLFWRCKHTGFVSSQRCTFDTGSITSHSPVAYHHSTAATRTNLLLYSLYLGFFRPHHI